MRINLQREASRLWFSVALSNDFNVAMTEFMGISSYRDSIIARKYESQITQLCINVQPSKDETCSK